MVDSSCHDLPTFSGHIDYGMEASQLHSLFVDLLDRVDSKVLNSVLYVSHTVCSTVCAVFRNAFMFGMEADYVCSKQFASTYWPAAMWGPPIIMVHSSICSSICVSHACIHGTKFDRPVVTIKLE